MVVVPFWGLKLAIAAAEGQREEFLAERLLRPLSGALETS